MAAMSDDLAARMDPPGIEPIRIRIVTALHAAFSLTPTSKLVSKVLLELSANPTDLEIARAAGEHARRLAGKPDRAQDRFKERVRHAVAVLGVIPRTRAQESAGR
jgi:hypothetical protein